MEKAICKDCKAGYGEALGHAWKDTWMDDEDAHWHECENADCPVTDNSKKDGYGFCSGGACTEIQQC